MMAGMWLMGILWLAIVGGGIGLIVWVILRGRSVDRYGPRGSEDVALAALRNRFANGEIDETEYRERREILMARDAGHSPQGS